MPEHELGQIIAAADRAIEVEDFDSVVDFYDDAATLVIRPGLNVSGKLAIRRAFAAIAEHFNHSLRIEQDRIAVVEGGDTALVIAEAILTTTAANGGTTTVGRRSTYVFRRDERRGWLCLIDNSYGTDLLYGA